MYAYAFRAISQVEIGPRIHAMADFRTSGLARAWVGVAHHAAGDPRAAGWKHRHDALARRPGRSSFRLCFFAGDVQQDSGSWARWHRGAEPRIRAGALANYSSALCLLRSVVLVRP
jgi:hypothetical protein